MDPATPAVSAETVTSILVVDDSPMARKMLIKALPAQWQVTITQAGNGQEALAAYRSGKVDIMFLDLTMPEMDGFQVLETLQREDLNCFVVVVSADIQPQAQQRVFQLGAMAFIKKPVNATEVDAVLREFGFML
jgi:CheY-like chemotaxis protein